MPDTNSLVLLPPRHTAQAPSHSDSSKKNRPAPKTSFSHKLAKATTQKAALVEKKTVTAAPQKAAVATKPAAKPETSSKGGDENSAEQDSVKEGTEAEDQSTVSTGDKKAKTQKLATDDAEVATKPTQHLPLPKPETDKSKSDEKPASQENSKQKKDPQKSAANSSTGTIVQPGQVNPADKTDSSSGDSDSDSDAADGVAPAQSAFYGSGKVVSARAAANADASSTDSSDTATSTAAAADTTAESTAAASAVALPAALIADTDPKSSSVDGNGAVVPTDAAAIGVLAAGKTVVGVAGKAAAAPSPQAVFVQGNQPKIISSIQGQLMPHGGTMSIRLDPPELGALQVTVNLKNGVMTASFETSSDHATKLLSHSLGQLKSGLEAAGVHVEKLEVTQTSKQDSKSDSDSDSDSQQSPGDQQSQSQQDQQRREIVKQMWRKLSGGGDPLDLVA